MNSPVHLFVYGLLMTGGAGFRSLNLADRVRSLGPARIAGRLHHLGDYPGWIPDERGVVHGELLAFEDKALIGELDAYEGYDPANPAASEYRRVAVRLLGSDALAWAYEYNRPVTDTPIIATGDWHRQAVS